MKLLTCAGRKGGYFHSTACLSQLACGVVLFLTIQQFSPERGVLAHPQTSWDRAVCESPVLGLLRPFRFHLSEEFGGADRPYYACPWPAANTLLRVGVTVLQLLASHALMVVSLKRKFSELWFLWALCKYVVLFCVIGGVVSVSIDANQLAAGTQVCAANFKSGEAQLITLPGYAGGFDPQCDQGPFIYTVAATGVMALFCLLVALGAETLPRTLRRTAEAAEHNELRKQLTVPLSIAAANPYDLAPHVYHPPTMASVAALSPYDVRPGGVMTLAQLRGPPNLRSAGSQHGLGNRAAAILDRDLESQVGSRMPMAAVSGRQTHVQQHVERESSDFDGDGVE